MINLSFHALPNSPLSERQFQVAVVMGVQILAVQLTLFHDGQPRGGLRPLASFDDSHRCCA